MARSQLASQPGGQNLSLPSSALALDHPAVVVTDTWIRTLAIDNYHLRLDEIFGLNGALSHLPAELKREGVISAIGRFLEVEDNSRDRLPQALQLGLILLGQAEALRRPDESLPENGRPSRLLVATGALLTRLSAKVSAATHPATEDILDLPWKDIRAVFARRLPTAANRQYGSIRCRYLEALAAREAAIIEDVGTGRLALGSAGLPEIRTELLIGYLSAVTRKASEANLWTDINVLGSLWFAAVDGARGAIPTSVAVDCLQMVTTKISKNLPSIWLRRAEQEFADGLRFLSALERQADHTPRFFQCLAFLTLQGDAQSSYIERLAPDSMEKFLTDVYHTVADLMTLHGVKAFPRMLLRHRPALTDRFADPQLRAAYLKVLDAYFAVNKTDPRTIAPNFAPVKEMIDGGIVRGANRKNGPESEVDLTAAQRANLLFAAACEHNVPALRDLVGMPSTEASSRGRPRHESVKFALLTRLWELFDLCAVRCAESAFNFSHVNRASEKVLADLRREQGRCTDPKERQQLDTRIAVVEHYRTHGTTLDSIATLANFDPNASSQLALVATVAHAGRRRVIYRFMPTGTPDDRLKDELTDELTARGFGPQFSSNGVRVAEVTSCVVTKTTHEPPTLYQVRASTASQDSGNVPRTPLQLVSELEELLNGGEKG